MKSIMCHYCIEFEKQKYSIYHALGSVRFIRDVQGTLQQASYFYDHEHPIFKTFQQESRFIPQHLFKQLGCTFSKLKEILLGLGMRGDISEEDFIMFATQVEKDVNSGISVELLEPKLKVLFSHLLQLEVEKLQKDFIDRVRTIKFLAPLTIIGDLQKLHPPYAKHTSLVSLEGSLATSQDENVQLVWTSMTILRTKPKISTKEGKLLEAFGVLFTPQTALVLENLKNVCRAPCSIKEDLEIRSRVLTATYSFLQNQLPFDAISLGTFPIILVEENVLAELSQVVFRLEEDTVFRPYLFRVPPLLACYSSLLQNIGVEPEPTRFHYARVLRAIYEETKDKESPHGNQRRTLLKTTEKLFLLLNDSKPMNDLQRLKPLYLPASDGRLYDSATLVFNNCNSTREISCLESTFKFLAHLEHCSLFDEPYKVEKLLQQLPEDIRPKMLSQMTEESLDSMVPCMLSDSCELKGRLHGLLLSSSFQEALASLLRAQSQGQISAAEAAMECKAVFSKLEIICCEKIQTVLLKDSEPLKSTSLSKDVFIGKGEDGQCQVFLVHKEAMTVHETVTIMASLANEINGILKNILSPRYILLLVQMLTCSSPQDIGNVLKNHGISTKKSASCAAFSLPRPGEKIPSEWHDSLDMNILNSLKVGDYVGYMDPSGEDVYLYAIILEQLEPKVSGDTEVQMFRIDLGPDRVLDVTALDLYQLKRSCLNMNDCKELVMVENLEEKKEKQDKWFEKSLGDIKREIDERLNEIWKLSKEERKHSIRRLYLRYHPDKNIGQEKLATEVCKYLQQKVKDLEEGRTSSSHEWSNNQSSPSKGFSTFWRKWDGEASRHRKHREYFTRKSNCDYNFWSFHNKKQTRSRPEEASRWFRQAECDLRAASSDFGHSSPEWVLYKVHQAIEKSLIACLYKKHGTFEKDCPISDLAGRVSTFSSGLEEIGKKVSELERHGVDNKKTQYPNYHPSPGIPNDSLSSEKEETVLQVAKDVLDKIKSFIHQ